MHQTVLFLSAFVLVGTALSQAPAEPKDWVAVSNEYTNRLLAVEMKHHPETGSQEGLSEFDTKVSQPTLADEDQERREKQELLAQFKSAAAEQKQKEVKQDLEIIIRSVELESRQQDFARAHKVPFLNASGEVFEGLRVLLDEQTPADRHAAAVVRIREYAGWIPLTSRLRKS